MAYNPQDGNTVLGRPLGAIGIPIDSRSLFYDKVNIVRRAFISTAEVIEYFDTPFKRQGHFTIYINSTGILDSTGVITGGENVAYCWKNGTSDSDLVTISGGGGSGSTDWGTITNKPTVIGAGATQSDARAAIGAGTSNLTLGFTNTTAKAGDYTPSMSDVTGLNTALSNKVDKVAGKSLINDTEITRLTGIATGATANDTDANLKNTDNHTNGIINKVFTAVLLAKINSITEIFTTALKTSYDNTVTWISTNGVNLINHLSTTNNPHNVTKTQVGLGSVPNTDFTSIKQDTLVSGTNIKTINGGSILGSGDLVISGGGGSTTDASLLTSGTLADARLSANVPILETVGANKVIKKENLRVVAWGAGIEDFTDVNGESSGKISTSWLDTYIATPLALKANLASPTFTGTVGGITKSMVGLSSVDNTADTAKPVSTAQQTAINAKVADNLTASTTVAPSKTAVNNALALKANIAAATGTLIALTFVSDSVQGTVASPLTGNITGVTTGAQLGVVTLVIHNHTTAPTFDAKYKKLSGSGNYTTGVINYIFCEYINATEIIYSINQRT